MNHHLTHIKCEKNINRMGVRVDPGPSQRGIDTSDVNWSTIAGKVVVRHNTLT
jgi:hypothetical protein